VEIDLAYLLEAALDTEFHTALQKTLQHVIYHIGHWSITSAPGCQSLYLSVWGVDGPHAGIDKCEIDGEWKHIRLCSPID
jgi:hypothetical protein